MKKPIKNPGALLRIPSSQCDHNFYPVLAL